MRINKVISFLFADDEGYSLEHHLFLSAIIVGIIISLLGALINLILSTSPYAVILPVVLAVFVIIIYYFVRFKKIVKPFVTPIIIISLFGISAIWIFNGGINGSNIMPAFVILILGLVVVPDNTKKYIFFLFLVLNIFILLIQFYRPDLITNFPNETDRWIDNLVTIIYSSFLIFIIIRFVHKNYTQERLKSEENERKYRRVVETVGEGIGFVNAEEEFLIVNPAAERIFGVGSGELVGKKLKDFLSPEQYATILSQTNVRKSGESSNYEFELTRPDGIKRNINITAVPQFDDNKNFVGTHGIFRDITETRLSDLALKNSEQQFTLFMNYLPALVFMKDDESNPVYVNKSMDIALGASKWIGLSAQEVFDPETAKRIINDDKKTLQLGYQKIEESFMNLDGAVHHYETQKFIIPRLGQKPLLGGIAIDFTERKKGELERIEGEKKLVHLNADKDLFISILGHDLKSPFNSILGLSEILSEDIHSLNNDEIADIASQINKSARSTFNLLEEILMWARAQQGKVPYKPQKLIFTDICKNVHDHLNLAALEKNISIDCSIQDTLEVLADVDMVKAVMRNLVSNAIKFTNPGGTVNISSEQSDSIVTISVSDNGIGIDPESLSMLFDITAGISTAGTAKESGTGLGLLLCKEFVAKHGGRIWCESEVGKGSIFSFTLPLYKSGEL